MSPARRALRASCALLSLSSTFAQQPPAWAQFRVTAQHTGVSSLSGPPPAALPEAWSLASPDGTAVFSSPAIAGDGTAYYMTQGGAVVAVEPLAAAPAWVYYPTAGPVPLAAEAAPAITANGDRVYVAAGAYLYSLNTEGALNNVYNAQQNGFGNITFPPAASAAGSSPYLAVPTSSNVLIFYFNQLSSPQYVLPGSYIPSGPLSSIDSDPSFGYCLFFATTTNAAVKFCPSYSQYAPVWAAPLPEASPFAPVIVASTSTVYFVTGGPAAFILGFALLGATNVSTCAGQLGSALGSAPAWLGSSSFGLAAVSSLASGGAAVMLTGPLPSSACTLAAAVAGTPPSAGSALAIDANRTAFYGSSSGTLVALNLSGATPLVAWTSPLPLAGSGGGGGGGGSCVGAVRSSPALGPGRNVVLGCQDGSGAGFLVSLKPICGAGAYYSQAQSACLPCPANSYQPQSNASALACTPCPAGSDTRGNASCTAAAACRACAAGGFSPAAGSGCSGCAAGSFSPAGATNCTLCPAGTASAAANATSAAVCAPCAPGSAAAAAGAASCASCAAGAWAPGGAINCTADAQSCYTGDGAGADCAAALPFAQFGADTAHSARAAGAGPLARPGVARTPFFSAALPVSGLALGLSGGVVAGLPVDNLYFVGTSAGLLGVSTVNGAVVNSYGVAPPAAFPGSPAVAPWGYVYAVDADFRLSAFPALESGAPLWTFTPPGGGGAQQGYAATPPAAHSVTRAVYYNAGPDGIACVDGLAGTRRWLWQPGESAACSVTPALDLAGASVYVGCDDQYVYSLSAAAGLLQWSYRTGAAVRASLTLSADGALLFAATLSDNLLALDAAAGTLRWLPVAVSPAAALAAPAIAADAVIVALTDGTVFAANSTYALSGNIKWRAQLDGPVVAPPTLGAADAAQGAPGGTAFIGTLSGSLYALDLLTGAITWRLALGEPLTQAAVILARGDTLLLPSNSSAAVFTVQALAGSPSPSASPPPSPPPLPTPSPPPPPAPSGGASTALVIGLSVALSASVVGMLAGVAYARGLWRLGSGAGVGENMPLVNPLLAVAPQPVPTASTD